MLRRLSLSTMAIALALAGIAVAAYLTVVHFNSDTLVCGLGDCHTVQSSEFATVGPIPVALLGLGMYAIVLVCHLVAGKQPAWSSTARSIAFAVALAGSVYALYLTWIEVAVIEAICQWCVVSAILTLALTLLLGLALWRAFSSPIVTETETEGSHAAS